MKIIPEIRMRYRNLFYASILPTAVFAQSSVPVPTGVAHYPSFPVGGNSTHGHKSTHPIVPGTVAANASSLNIKNHQPTGFSTAIPPKQSTNVTGVYIATSLNGSKHSLAAQMPHGPYTKPIGALSVNYTTSNAAPTGTRGDARSGTGVSQYRLPTGAGNNQSAYSEEPFASPTGRLPIPVTRGSTPHYSNSTVVNPYHIGTGTPHIGTGISSSFANVTTPTAHTNEFPTTTSTSRRVPFTKSNGFHFANSTSGFAMPTGSGHVRPPGASSSFARPTIIGHTDHLANSSTATSTSARLPYTKSNGFHFANSTSVVAGITGTGASGFIKPVNTGIISAFPTASGHPPYSNVSQPQSNSPSVHAALPTTPPSQQCLLE
ncbi:hypothetical protein BKA64DRAFT_398128 [Cadophora sp. MPI-SDFR-AT-0126]|nr:hypothetical protein BKA64DRAFT_398128 [Leotiomycetes sp. MPI-SDFR-AT-0126]